MLHRPYLIDGKADGVHVLSVTAMASSVLLHKSHKEAAGNLVILWIIILLQQSDLILRVDPERVCKSEDRSDGVHSW